MMPGSHPSPALPDAGARQRALLDYDATLLVEAGAGSGKTALMAGRVVLMLAHGIRPRDIVAVTFTEAAAAELLERIERFVASLKAGSVPPELQLALPTDLSDGQRAAIATAATALDEITCTTIHGFCQQLIKPYPIEAGIDPGECVADLERLRVMLDGALNAPMTGRVLARLLLQEPPACCHGSQARFKPNFALF